MEVKPLVKRERFTSIKSIFVDLSIYFMSLLTIPISIAKRLVSTQCRFLWDNSEDRKIYHLVAWDEIKKPMSQGGLGLRSLMEMNMALRGKCLRRFIKENNIFTEEGDCSEVVPKIAHASPKYQPDCMG